MYYNFEKFTLMFVSDIKKLTYRHYMKQPMRMIHRKMLRQFFERGGNYKYSWLPDCIRSHYIELRTMQSCSKNFFDNLDFHVTARVTHL